MRYQLNLNRLLILLLIWPHLKPISSMIWNRLPCAHVYIFSGITGRGLHAHAVILHLYLPNKYVMYVASCLADAIFFERWSTGAAASDLVDFIILACQPVATRHNEHHADGTHLYRIGLQVWDAVAKSCQQEKVVRELTADQMNSDPVGNMINTISF